MISRRLKATYYSLLNGFMWLNGRRYRAFAAPREGIVRVHLGPGQRNYLPGWINIDANFLTAKVDVWANIEHALPFRDNSVDCFYSHHVIEHLADANLSWHFREMYRCLKPGGMMRVGGPNGDGACRKYVEGDLSWFIDFPDNRSSAGGRFANFILCRGEHLTILTPSYLDELAKPIGFTELQVCKPATQTFHPGRIDAAVLATEVEPTPDCPHTLLIEAVKPARR